MPPFVVFMADISGLGGSTRGNEQQATEQLRGMGISSPSSGLVRFLAYGAQDYGYNEATQYGLPISGDMLRQERERAIAPAVESLRASKPEVSAKYTQARGQLESEKTPLIERYQNLIDQLKGRESRDVSEQGKALSGLYSQRGITLESPAYQQDLTNKLSGINQFYGVQEKDVGFERETKLRDISNLIQTTFSSEIEDLRGIDNAIAQLQASGASQAITDALTMIQNQKQQDLQLKIAQLQSQTTPEFKLQEFGNNLYSFNPTTNELLNLATKPSSTGSTGTPLSVRGSLQGQTGNVPTSKKPYTQAQLNNFKIFGITPP